MRAIIAIVAWTVGGLAGAFLTRAFVQIPMPWSAAILVLILCVWAAGIGVSMTQWINKKRAEDEAAK
jgi:uncharacterized membrane protein